MPSSAHPVHITPNIVYSMGFRLLRICSSEEKFKSRLQQLKTEFLMPRNYNLSLIESEFDRVRDDDFSKKRRGALKFFEKQAKNHHRIIAPLDFTYEVHLALHVRYISHAFCGSLDLTFDLFGMTFDLT